MRRFAFFALASLVAVTAAHADIGIRNVSKRHARPGDAVTVTARGFLGPRPWAAMPVVIVAAGQAPRPFLCGNGYCSPRMRAKRLRRPPYRFLGEIRRWRPLPGGRGAGSLEFDVPALAPGRYVFGLFCDPCVAGVSGSLIIDHRLALRIAPA
jgi:hypothetical protein